MIFGGPPRDQVRDRNSQSINDMGFHPRADARSSTVTDCTENKGTPGRTRRVYSWQVATSKRLSRPLNRTCSRQSDQPRACMEGCLVGTKRDDNLIPYPQIEA
jgi:hypothetical protein